MLGAAGEQLAVYNGVQVKFDREDNETERFVYVYLHSYISAGGQLVTLANGTKQFNIVDNLGSVRCIVSWDGTSVSTQAFDYKPFGDLQNAGEENRIGYFGEQRDKESDYFAMGFRLYDPEIGRFLAIDPLLDIQPSQTPYHYCFNNPTSFTDPTGLYPEKEKGDKVQAVVSFYWVLEEAFHSLMNNKISYEENWQMARRQWRGLFYLISDKNYNDRMYGNGGGGGGSSSGRTGTKNEYSNGIIVNKYGVIIGETLNSSDKNKVFQLNEDDNSLDYIGDVGGVIDISNILPNILDKNADIANDLNIFEFADKVRDYGDWDLKNDTEIIFGLAWSISDKYGVTNFLYDDIYFKTAADVGNYHYGYVGRAADINYLSLWIGAGIAESVKNLVHGDFGLAFDLFNKSRVGILPTIPFNDRTIDFFWTTTGMRDYDKRK